ncbi:MAG: ammonia channel protein [Pelagibacterales bacterium]|nr:ammonia channel protein [Pelagibacterales bacterium]OUU62675.1 MAG: ammonia channel protein [Alphaproteobacteria bacterium TMED62]|tara:strand:- start:2436 stop:3632 length:1197 start_codon:yes stop_codon:yes gene_type:complete
MIEGNTAWILTSTALVLFMTLPGLALFYGGLVYSKNLISVLIQCFAVACLMSITWFIAGYSIAFTETGEYFGNLSKAFLSNVSADSEFAGLPESVFFMFQMTFAIITPALIVGAFVERAKFLAVLIFSCIWLLVAYAPITHWIWGGGWLAKMGVQDFAGGLVVHLNCGVAALVFAYLLGPRNSKKQLVPHSPPLAMIGTSMLWIGWFGFNGGSALAADGNAGMAMTVTHISASTAALVWMAIEWVKHGKPTLVGVATGCIAGLATITPASGFVGPSGALVIGILAAIICYYMVGFVKNFLKIDDTLDVFAVHGIGGLLGTLLLAPLGSKSLGGLGLSEVGILEQLNIQILASIAVAIWSGIVSFIILIILKNTIGIRVSRDEEEAGLDRSSHSESAYN